MVQEPSEEISLKKKKKKEKKVHSSSHQAVDDDDEDDTSRRLQEFKARKNARYDDRAPEAVDKEPIEEIDKDIQERDEFAKRLRLKDQEKQKKKSKRELEQEEQDEKRRKLADDQDAMLKELPQRREASRQEYLVKRGAQQLELLRREVEEERAMFARDELTAKERRELDFKEETLRLADQRSKIQARVEGYTVSLPLSNPASRRLH